MVFYLGVVPLGLHFTCISFTSSLEETIIYRVLKGYLHVGMSLSSLCGFTVFGMRAVFSVDAYCVFPQHVLVGITLTGSVQMQQLVPSPEGLGGGGGSDAPLEQGTGVEAVHDHC